MTDVGAKKEQRDAAFLPLFRSSKVTAQHARRRRESRTRTGPRWPGEILIVDGEKTPTDSQDPIKNTTKKRTVSGKSRGGRHLPRRQADYLVQLKKNKTGTVNTPVSFPILNSACLTG